MNRTRLAVATSLVSFLVLGGCSAAPTAQDQMGSNLTAVSVNLPEKEKLPKSLLEAESKLMYCFSISHYDGAPAYSDSKQSEPKCTFDDNVSFEDANSASVNDTVSKKGLYQSALQLDGKLLSNKAYEITLAIGYMEKTDQATDADKDADADADSVSKRKDPDALALTEPGTDALADANIDKKRVYYVGTRWLFPHEMQGKSSLKIVMNLFPFNKTSEDPGSINTGEGEASEVDLEVEPIFNDEAP